MTTVETVYKSGIGNKRKIKNFKNYKMVTCGRKTQKLLANCTFK